MATPGTARHGAGRGTDHGRPTCRGRGPLGRHARGAVVSATGNETLLTLLEGISGRTLRARIWRGLVDDKAAGRALAEHEAISNALSALDATLSQAAALLHVSNTEQWLREYGSARVAHRAGHGMYEPTQRRTLPTRRTQIALKPPNSRLSFLACRYPPWELFLVELLTRLCRMPTVLRRNDRVRPTGSRQRQRRCGRRPFITARRPTNCAVGT